MNLKKTKINFIAFLSRVNSGWKRKWKNISRINKKTKEKYSYYLISLDSWAVDTYDTQVLVPISDLWNYNLVPNSSDFRQLGPKSQLSEIGTLWNQIVVPKAQLSEIGTVWNRNSREFRFQHSSDFRRSVFRHSLYMDFFSIKFDLI